MLTLTRAHGEAIRIGDDVVIRVRRITPTRTELSIEAPASTRVVRADALPTATPQTSLSHVLAARRRARRDVG